VAKPRSLTQKPGWAFATCLAIVKPPVLLLTKHRWIDGRKLPATGGCVVVSNHISHLDPFTFAHFVYDHGRLPRYLAKNDVFNVPIGGRLVKKAGQIPVYRLTSDAATAFSAAVDAVNKGECVVVYPEGTISRDHLVPADLQVDALEGGHALEGTRDPGGPQALHSWLSLPRT